MFHAGLQCALRLRPLPGHGRKLRWILRAAKVAWNVTITSRPRLLPGNLTSSTSAFINMSSL